MNFILSTLLIFLLSILFFVMGHREKILPSIYFDINVVSIVFVSFGYLFKNPHRKLFTYLFLIFITVLFCFSTFQNIIDFPTNSIINRNSIRFFHYGTLLGLILLARRYPNSLLLYTGYAFIIHTNYFQVSEAKGIYLIPLAILALLNQKVEFTKSQNTIFSIFSIYILSLLFLYDYNRNQEIVLIFYLVLVSLFLLIVHALDKEEKKVLMWVLFIQYIIQFTFFNIYILILWISTSEFPSFPLVFLFFPTSLLAIYSLLAILTSVYNLITSKYILIKVLSIYLLIISSAMLYVSHSITSILSLMFGIISLLLMQNFVVNFYHRNKRLFYLLIFLLLSFSTATLVLIFNMESKLYSFLVRIDIWKYYLSMTFHKHPFLGFGSIPEWKLFYVKPSLNLSPEINQIHEYISSFNSFPPAHSFYIEWFASFGCVGLLILIFNASFYFKEIFKKMKIGLLELSNHHKFAIVTLIIFSIHGISDFHLLENQVTIAFLLFLSFLYDSKSKTNQKSSMSIYNFVFMIFFFMASIWITIQSIELVRFRRAISKDYIFHNLKIIESKYGNKKLSIPNLQETNTLTFYPKDINYNIWKIITTIDSGKNSVEKKKQIEDEIQSCYLEFSNHPYCIQASMYYSKKMDHSINLNLYKEILDYSDFFQGKKYE
jgi:hypothetical protein